MKDKFLVLLFLSVFAGLCLSSMAVKSPTTDEIGHHIPCGYIFLDKGDIKMGLDTPPLPRYIAALPLKLFMDIKVPDDPAVWRTRDRTEFSRALFYEYGKDPDRMIFLARVPFVLTGVFLGLLVFRWTSSLYGRKAALAALFMYSLSPNMIAHSRLATSDIFAAFTVFLSAFSFWRFLRDDDGGVWKTVFAGVCLGLAQLSKYTALLLYPAFVLSALFLSPGGKSRPGKSLAVRVTAVFLISAAVIWAGYGFSADPVLEDALRVPEKLSMVRDVTGKVFAEKGEEAFRLAEKALTGMPCPLGEHILGVLGVIKHNREGHRVYFWGEWAGKGNPLYFLGAFAVKTPLPIILLLILGVVITIIRKARREDLYVMFVPSFFFAAASFAKLQLGLRYILMVYPFVFMLAGAGFRRLTANKRSGRFVALALLAWLAFGTLSVWPDYLAYFNEAAGGPEEGWKYLRDSNIDWGQDLPALADYLEKRHIDGEIGLLYFGVADPGHYGIRHYEPSDAEKASPGNKVYAVSVNYLESVEWTENTRPDVSIGHSINVYDLREKNKRR
ncbi:MAG: phospholipid carrier-dependent glycosyltransferase [Candidatus Omnitrophica bacterium]|nr:phospholipid carrier-dependent glycosyltransferase [Candidatus Omnitrophota bacterium]